jgi:hypothetical protein
MKKIILIAGLTAALSAPAFAGVNLVQDGNFANPNVGGGWTITAGTPWTNLNDSGIEVGYSPIYGLPKIGSGQNLELNGNTWGDVVQTVSGLVVGDYYKLSYLYGGRTSGDPASAVSSFGGKTLTTDSGSIGAWTLDTFSVKATATSEVLEFKAIVSGNSPSYGNEYTNVSVSAPEVSTWVMMLAGFAGLGFVGWRRQKAVQA